MAGQDRICAAPPSELFFAAVRIIAQEDEEVSMFTFLLWCVLFVLCWPLALLALVAYPFIWLLLLPFRLVGVAVHGVLEIVFLAITLPFRLLAAPFRV
jgi:hypothetical protein